MKQGLGHASHLFRMAGLFVVGLVLFLIVRSLLVPADFGAYGHFRAGALADNREKPLVYAGRQACADCHDEAVARKAAGAHAGIGCETCHGALAAHAGDPSTGKPERPDPRVTCLVCHERNAGKPSWFKAIVVEEHAPSGPCADCHVPHNPTIG
jgi:hypothetical protein